MALHVLLGTEHFSFNMLVLLLISTAPLIMHISYLINLVFLILPDNQLSWTHDLVLQPAYVKIAQSFNDGHC